MRLLLLPLLFLGLATHSTATESLRVATYNIRLKLDSDTARGNGWDTRKEQVLALIRFHDFELIGFQEVLKPQLDDLAACTEFGFVGVGRDDGQAAGEHAPIFYRKDRFRLLDSGTFWLSETPDRVSFGWDATKYRRICTWARLEDLRTGKVFQVWNAHFDHEAVLARRNAASLILARVREVTKQGIPVIVMGDLNATPDSEPYRILAAGLRDTRPLSSLPSYGPEGTFNAFDYDKPALDRIDHLFVSEGVRVLRHGTLTDAVNRRFPSDHFPVMTELQF